MNIPIKINKHQALIAVMHSIDMGAVFNSRKDFITEMKNYFHTYGISCIDDHESESAKYRGAAQFVVDKYFKL